MELVVRLLLEKIFEAIYFSVFLIIGKEIKNKRFLFIVIMIIEYLLLKEIIKYNIWFNLLYTFMSFINLKVLYKEKSQITDIFLFSVASIILIIISVLSAIFALIVNNYIIALIINRLLVVLFLVFFKDKINKKYKDFYSLWNRHHNSKRIRSLTLRNISVIIFNLMFWLLNILMVISVSTR